jgi:hypothetical protein
MCYPRSDLASHIQVHNARTGIKKAASLASQERRNSHGGVGHAEAGTQTKQVGNEDSEKAQPGKNELQPGTNCNRKTLIRPAAAA